MWTCNFLVYVCSIIICLWFHTTLAAAASQPISKSGESRKSGDYRSSIPFTLVSINFECPSVTCKFPVLEDSVFHLVVGTDHDSYFPTLVNRVCEAYQKCMSASNMKIILQTASKELANELSFAKGAVFLNSLGINYIQWAGTFTGDKKMLHTFEALRDVNKESLIYQTDIDEIPEPHSLNRALGELQSGQCNAIRAKWADRLAIGGELPPIVLDGTRTMQQQFPLRCRISPNFVGRRIEKIIVYSASYRIDGGHHEVWCSPLTGLGAKGAKSLKSELEMSQLPESVSDADSKTVRQLSPSPEGLVNATDKYRRNCRQHIKGRQKQVYYKDIMHALPRDVNFPAKYCPTIVVLDHFKFVDGMQSYLRTRWETYRNKNIPWWTDSWKFLTHIERYNNSVCVDCAASQCYNVRTRKKLTVDHKKKFYCGNRGNVQCATSEGYEITDVGTKAYKQALRVKDAAAKAEAKHNK